ncbi:hypothetical protein [Roseobacter sp.]|uniref:hypothetical protein n=1 Tax=Roseobacter sp. TaxID=1907202 RepID=UPI0029669628|nr:hypothetical protein [Roseobacter sp.]
MQTALNQYEEIVGEAFPTNPILNIVEDGGFWAVSEVEKDKFNIFISTGVEIIVSKLWRDALDDNQFVTGIGTPVSPNIEDMTHLSLAWLMLHEMEHYRFGHFELARIDFPVEKKRAYSFALISRRQMTFVPLADVAEENCTKVEPCLEMQADHDAIELILDSYSREEWESLRHRVLAISGMMMLIEQEDTKCDYKPPSHPKAATRIFQLLGHLIDMPMISAQIKAKSDGRNTIDPADLPSDKERVAFNRQVTLPCFFDAVNLAKIAGADSILRDLGEAADFFGDVQIAKSMSAEHFTSLKTVGAKQWAELVKFNEILKKQQIDKG